MAEWIECSIGDLCNTISDTYKGNDEYVVLVNTSDVLEGKVLNHEPVVNKNLKGQFKKTFKKNDILYSEIRPVNKRFAYIDFENTSNYIASTKLMVLRHNDKVLPEYLFALVKSNYVIAELQHLAETRSGTFPQITFSSELAPMKVLLPDKDTQKRIVSVLSNIELKIDENIAINNNLLQQAEALFKKRFLSCNELPFGWARMALGDVSDMSAGGDKPQIISNQKTKEHQYPVYSNGISDEGLYGFTTDYKISAESVTVSARGTIGFVCLRHIPYTPIVRLVTLVPHTNIVSAKYLYLWLKSVPIHGTGTTQQQLTVPDFRKTEILIPPKADMSEFTETVNSLFQQVWANQEENTKLADIRDTLLPRLMSGELDVSSIEI